MRTNLLQYLDDWFDGKRAETAPSTMTFYRSSLTKFLQFLSKPSDDPMTEVTKQDVVAFRNSALTALYQRRQLSFDDARGSCSGKGYDDHRCGWPREFEELDRGGMWNFISKAVAENRSRTTANGTAKLVVMFRTVLKSTSRERTPFLVYDLPAIDKREAFVLAACPDRRRGHAQKTAQTSRTTGSFFASLFPGDRHHEFSGIAMASRKYQNPITYCRALTINSEMNGLGQSARPRIKNPG